MGHELAALFDYSHLPENLQAVSKPFAELASKIMYEDPYQSNTGLQYQMLMKLWEVKNLAVVTADQF